MLTLLRLLDLCEILLTLEFQTPLHLLLL
eukprot:COSAG06_NODE_54588_length_293_cov_177.938144_1_plen_28_part_10